VEQLESGGDPVAFLRELSGHSALKELERRDHHPEPDHQHGTQPDGHGGGQKFKVFVKAGGLGVQVLAQHGELLAQVGLGGDRL
jgi:hypothetical protein